MYHHLCLFCLIAVGIDFESRMWRLTFKRRYSDIKHSKLRKKALDETKNSKSNVLNRLSVIFNIKRKHMIGDVNINYLLRLLEFVLEITLFEYMMHCYGIIPVSSWHNIISWMLSKAIQKVLYYKLYTGLQYVLLKLFQISETNQCPMQVLPLGLVLAADNHVYHWQVDELWLPWLPTAMYHQVLVSCMWLCNLHLVIFDCPLTTDTKTTITTIATATATATTTVVAATATAKCLVSIYVLNLCNILNYYDKYVCYLTTLFLPNV